MRQMRQRLKAEIDVVGVGGVSRGVDAFELILCGATAVQVGTKHYKEGPRCFDRIATELEVCAAYRWNVAHFSIMRMAQH